jgi:hypothetical protein
MAIRTDAVYRLQVIALVFIVASSWGFVWFCHFPLLIQLAEMLNLGFAEFCKLVV